MVKTCHAITCSLRIIKDLEMDINMFIGEKNDMMIHNSAMANLSLKGNGKSLEVASI